MYKKSAINFKLQELNSFVGDPKSCVKCVHRKQHLSVLPWCLGDLKKSIEGLLNRKTAHYDKSLDGILLSARNITLLSTLGALRHDSPEIHMDIEADFYIFQPEVGSVLEGIVIKKNEHFIGCLVHRVFNITIPRNNEQNWPGSYLEIGSNVIFKVIYMDLMGRLPYIRGEIDASSMEFGDVSVSDPTLEKHVHLGKSKKNKKTYFDDLEDIENEHSVNVEVDDSSKKSKKSKKTKKHKKDLNSTEHFTLEHNEYSVVEDSILENVEKKIKKKSKKNTEAEVPSDVFKSSSVINIDKYKNKNNQILSPAKTQIMDVLKSPDTKKGIKKRKPRTDSEGYSSENIHDFIPEKSNTKNKSSIESTSQVNVSKRESLVSNLLEVVKSSMNSSEKSKKGLKKLGVSGDKETTTEETKKISKKRKLSVESPIKTKKMKKS